jgi:hypothetical protein
MNVLKGIRGTKIITTIAKVRVVACEISYALAVIVAMILVPFALLLRAVAEIRAAMRHGPIIHGYAKPVYH